jgi:hypothetical protein
VRRFACSGAILMSVEREFLARTPGRALREEEKGDPGRELTRRIRSDIGVDFVREVSVWDRALKPGVDFGAGVCIVGVVSDTPSGASE